MSKVSKRRRLTPKRRNNKVASHVLQNARVEHCWIHKPKPRRPRAKTQTEKLSRMLDRELENFCKCRCLLRYVIDGIVRRVDMITDVAAPNMDMTNFVYLGCGTLHSNHICRQCADGFC